MKITKHEAESIMSMLNSKDEENGYLAFKAIEAHDFSEPADIGYLIYFYKFSRYEMSVWHTQAPSVSDRILKVFDENNLNKTPLSYATALTVMVRNKVSKDSIELYLERHVKDLTNSLETLGYPIDKLDFQLKLKE